MAVDKLIYNFHIDNNRHFLFHYLEPIPNVDFSFQILTSIFEIKFYWM
nr:MAG TPA: hypothetical protein [Caudoviricetes sp.]